MFMFLREDSFPYYTGLKVESGPDKHGYYNARPGLLGWKPLYLCSDEEGEALMARRKSMKQDFDTIHRALRSLEQELLKTVPPELRT